LKEKGGKDVSHVVNDLALILSWKEKKKEKGDKTKRGGNALRGLGHPRCWSIATPKKKKNAIGFQKEKKEKKEKNQPLKTGGGRKKKKGRVQNPKEEKPWTSFPEKKEGKGRGAGGSSLGSDWKSRIQVGRGKKKGHFVK